MSTITLGKNRPRMSRKVSNKRRKAPRRSSGTGAFRVVRNVLYTLIALGAVGVLGVILLYGYRLVTSHSYFNLSEVVVNGNEHLSRGEVLKLGHVELGKNSVNLNVSEVERLVSNSPWVTAATVRRELPNRLYVDVAEKKPAFWTVHERHLYFTDAEGAIIAEARPGEHASLPLLRKAGTVHGGSNALAGFVEHVRSGKAPFGMEQVAWVRVLPSRQIEAQLDGINLTLMLDMDRWDTQLERINTAWRDLARRGEFSKVASVQATGDKVWVRLRG
ncbi:cell division protein FtsQ/DivIB [Salidesulfovibrio brasiliensis]|uniref:cell division protein FtsQ/DivIB n=1 Tax=Salidesulfovibrio brasiliensis TaxID=221711 RepID=UPI0006D04E3B|nr:FtsQ-type POTRA domain-containing protein [Salidesulfovibrio brasiliensis]